MAIICSPNSTPNFHVDILPLQASFNRYPLHTIYAPPLPAIRDRVYGKLRLNNDLVEYVQILSELQHYQLEASLLGLIEGLAIATGTTAAAVVTDVETTTRSLIDLLTLTPNLLYAELMSGSLRLLPGETTQDMWLRISAMYPPYVVPVPLRGPIGDGFRLVSTVKYLTRYHSMENIVVARSLIETVCLAHGVIQRPVMGTIPSYPTLLAMLISRVPGATDLKSALRIIAQGGGSFGYMFNLTLAGFNPLTITGGTLYGGRFTFTEMEFHDRMNILYADLIAQQLAVLKAFVATYFTGFVNVTWPTICIDTLT